ncbi:hypothetical protein [Microbulbifer agarilyticus]|uniref:hypothetical protein n=1 Tax=Microbulbifer agarilyticus TaxID=260552 RepID=UPI001CD240F0|nr:hypothetical protein [Microbulbifer agarilyticus]MCA0892614.1 hypothetical protein [Microbulbifer agarilyticus]
MRLFTATCLIFCSVWAHATGSFYANPELQRKMPAAFALQPEAQAFLAPAFQQTIAHGDALVAAIQQDAELAQAIADWPKLTIEQQVPYLKRVFAIETQVMGIEPPTLLIDNYSYPGRMVYFDFDPQNPSTGTVYLNPDKLAERPKYDSLAFLIHETRHSLQFQHAFSVNIEGADTLATGYAEAFKAQKALKGFSFSDFLTLVNGYEAFQFGNYVLGKLTNWQLDTRDMGTYASQFDTHGKLKIDLVQLATEDAESSLLERYNVQARKHFDLRERKAKTKADENKSAD